MSNSKTVYLKLSTPRLSLLIEGVITAVENGWGRLNPSIVHTSSPMKVLLKKEVPLDSLWPKETVWNCRGDIPSEPLVGVDPIIQDVIDNSNVNLIEESTITNLLDKMEDIGNNITLISEDFSESIKASDEVGTYELIATDSGNTEDTPQDVVTNASANKTPDGFEQRPYSAEELESWKWQDIMKLSASLNVADGKRVERTEAIVKASQEQWGSV